MRKFLLTTTLLVWASGAFAQVTPGQGSITDPSGNVWAITASGSIKEGDAYTPGGGGTSALMIVGGIVYGQDNGHDGNTVNSGGWFTLSGGQNWIASAPPAGVATTAPSSPAASATAPAATPVAATQAVAPPTVCGSGAASGSFKIVGGRIIGPDGKDWIGRGINAYDSQLDEASAMTAMFTGLNFIRISVGHDGYHDPSYYQAFISQMTSAGRVVELEHHPDGGGGQDAPYTGSQLAEESAWYASVGGAFANNPYVWFGTFNEPGVGGAGQLSAWHQATYNAIRNTGNNNPILIEPGGSRPPNLVASLVPGVYASMKNIIMDPHVYGYQTNYSTDQATNDANVAAMIAAAQTIQTADGMIGVMIAEYGNSTQGDSPDPNGVQNVTAVVSAGGSGKAGSAAWAWLPGGNSDHLQDGGQLTSPYGQQVALYINTSVISCSAIEATANATAAITAATAQATAAPPDSATTAADASLAQANAVIAAAQAQMKTIPGVTQ